MSNEVLGAYMRLLAFNWMKGSLPADEQKLAKLSSCGRRWGKVRATLLPLFPQIVDKSVDNCPNLTKDSRSDSRFGVTELQKSKVPCVSDPPRLSNTRVTSDLAKVREYRDMQRQKALLRHGKVPAPALPLQSTGRGTYMDLNLNTNGSIGVKGEQTDQEKPKRPPREDKVAEYHIDQIGEKLEPRLSGYHPDRGFHAIVVRKVPQSVINEALAAVADARANQTLNNAAGYFKATIKRLAGQEGIQLDAEPHGT